VVTINAPPVLIVTPPISFCNSPTVDITSPSVITSNTAGASLSYWQDALASIPLASPNAIASNGTYYIKSTLGNCFVIKPVLVTLGSGGSIANPIVTTPIYLCQNSVATSLAATALIGATLNWYGTNAIGGIASSIAPIPSTTTVGSTTYYVSQSSGSCESARVGIVINVVADNGATILSLVCDSSQILSADKNSSVFFDWANSPLISDNSYNFSYTIEAGAPITGNTTVSHIQVFGMLPGQSATIKLTSATHPCVPEATMKCSVPCGALTITPNFPAIAPFCSGTTAPILDNTIPSPNGVVGTWSPATISNTISGSYVFTPDLTLNPCALPQTINTTVTPVTNAGTLSGVQNVCVGSTTNLSSTTAGGTWSSSDVTIATVNAATGLVTGVSAGTATITYLV